MIDQRSIEEVSFDLYSQYNEQALISYFLRNLPVPYGDPGKFIDIGAANGIKRSNTYSLARSGWEGWCIEARKRRAGELLEHYEERGFPVHVVNERITSKWITDNADWFPKDAAVLSLDIDSYDYFVMRALLECKIRPTLCVVEYNPNFGPSLSISVQNGEKWTREFRNLYYGASLAAFKNLFAEFGYTFICCESHGSNAFFVDLGQIEKPNLRVFDGVRWLQYADNEMMRRLWGTDIEGRLQRMRANGMHGVEV